MGRAEIMRAALCEAGLPLVASELEVRANVTDPDDEVLMIGTLIRSNMSNALLIAKAALLAYQAVPLAGEDWSWKTPEEVVRAVEAWK